MIADSSITRLLHSRSRTKNTRTFHTVQAQNVTKARLVLGVATQTRSWIFHQHDFPAHRGQGGIASRAGHSAVTLPTAIYHQFDSHARSRGTRSTKDRRVPPRSSEIGDAEWSLVETERNFNEAISQATRTDSEQRSRIFHSRSRIRENPGRGRE